MPDTPSAAKRQSYYLPADVHEKLSKAAEDLLWEFRLPKNVTLTAIIQYGLDHLPEVRAALKEAGAQEGGASAD